MTIRREVVKQLAGALDPPADPSAIADTDLLAEDLGLGSLDAIMLMLDFEEQYGVEINDDELKELDTVASLLTLIELRMPVESSTDQSPGSWSA